MNYTKPPLTFEQQAHLLIGRGLEGDPQRMSQCLAAVNYYRLSGYWHPFKNPDETFKPGTTFESIWQRYAFDRRFRLLVMDAIERIEVAVRCQLSFHLAHAYGAFGYATDPRALPKLGPDDRALFLKRVRDEVERSKEAFVGHFKAKYGDSHAELPIWMATELMALGSIVTLFQGSSNQTKKAVAAVFGMPHEVFGSWLRTLNVIRNTCAHHGRLWNRVLGFKPLIPRQRDYPDWHHPVEIANDKLFGILTICNYCLRTIAPQSHWEARLKALFAEFPDVPRQEMGFPENWLESPLWKHAGKMR